MGFAAYRLLSIETENYKAKGLGKWTEASCPPSLLAKVYYLLAVLSAVETEVKVVFS